MKPKTLPCIFLVAGITLQSQEWPKAVVESSNYTRTSTVADIRSYMDTLIKVAPALEPYQPKNAPKTTELGKPLLAWRVPATGNDPLKVYVNANIHPGEVEGKDAIQIVIKEILQGKHPIIRQNITLVACPAYNADGTDALDTANRLRQPNPENGVGPRENPFGLDLNRDMMKAVTANTRWMLAMYRDFDPDCTIDLHATNGSRHGFHITDAPAQCVGGDVALSVFNRRMITEVRENLRKIGLLTYDYGNFRLDENRKPVAWETESVSQNMASSYPLMENRLGVLVETYIYRPFEDRVKDNVKYILATLDWMARNKDEVKHQRCQAAKRWLDGLQSGALRLPLSIKMVETETYNFTLLDFATDEDGKPIRDNKGRYTFQRPGIPLTLPSRVTFEQTDYVTAPLGYIVDRAYAEKVQPILEAHGITVLPSAMRPKNETLMHFHETDRKVSASAFQGVFTLTLSGEWKPELPEKRSAYPWDDESLDSSLYIPINQPQGRLVFYLLDPRAPDGLVFWGMFNSSFIRGFGMWGEPPRFPILALGENAATPQIPK